MKNVKEIIAFNTGHGLKEITKNLQNPLVSQIEKSMSEVEKRRAGKIRQLGVSLRTCFPVTIQKLSDSAKN